ncbi:MAG: GNAT family N-acetyltransferase [Spirillospora sp.]
MKQLAVRGGGCRVRVRPYGVADRERVHRMSDRLSTASLYTRFFSGSPRIPDHYLVLLDGLDHWDREALIALDGDEIIGIAEYIRLPARRWSADVAVLVIDPWQRHGVGTVLVARLAELAGRRGVTEFGADVILTNRGGVRFVRRGWPAARSTTDGGSARFHLPLPMPA